MVGGRKSLGQVTHVWLPVVRRHITNLHMWYQLIDQYQMPHPIPTQSRSPLFTYAHGPCQAFAHLPLCQSILLCFPWRTPLVVLPQGWLRVLCPYTCCIKYRQILAGHRLIAIKGSGPTCPCSATTLSLLAGARPHSTSRAPQRRGLAVTCVRPVLPPPLPRPTRVGVCPTTCPAATHDRSLRYIPTGVVVDAPKAPSLAPVEESGSRRRSTSSSGTASLALLCAMLSRVCPLVSF